jgi:hypothetical protein
MAILRRLCAEYSRGDKVGGTVRWELFVRDRCVSLKLLASKLSVYRLESIESVYYYACDLNKILDIANGVREEIG